MTFFQRLHEFRQSYGKTQVELPREGLTDEQHGLAKSALIGGGLALGGIGAGLLMRKQAKPEEIRRVVNKIVAARGNAAARARVVAAKKNDAILSASIEGSRIRAVRGKAEAKVQAQLSKQAAKVKPVAAASNAEPARGRFTVARLNKSAGLREERGYGAFKPMTKRQRGKFDVLHPDARAEAGQLERIARDEGGILSPGQKQHARQRYGAFRKEKNFSSDEFFRKALEVAKLKQKKPWLFREAKYTMPAAGDRLQPGEFRAAIDELKARGAKKEFATGRGGVQMLKLAGAAGAVGVGAGAASLLRNPGRPLEDGENVGGKLLWRRSRIPLIRHYGVGVGKGRVAHVQANRPGDLATFKTVDVDGFKDDGARSRPVYVQAHRKGELKAIKQGVADRNLTPGQFNTLTNNCEVAANGTLQLKRPTSQMRDALVSGAVGAGGVVAGALAARGLIRKVRKFSARYFDDPTLTGQVARDRLIKRLRDEDLDRGIVRGADAAGAGAMAGLAVNWHRGGKKWGRSALIGAGLGAAGVAGVRLVTRGGRDIYGERSRAGKVAERIPAAAGVGLAGLLVAKKWAHHFEVKEAHPWYRSPALGAALSGGISGAAIGALPAFKRGVGLKTVLKSMAGAGAASAGVVGVGTLVGSKILGRAEKGGSAAYAKRAGLGGSIAGAGLGLGLGVLAHKTRWGARLMIRAAKTSRPALWARKAGPLGAAAIGTGGGALVGAGQGADEGQQVDSIMNVRRERARKLLSARLRLIHFGFTNQPKIDDSFISDGEMRKGHQHGRYESPVRWAYGVGANKLMPNPDGSDAGFGQAQMVRGFIREGKGLYKWGGRAARTARDAGHVALGKPRLRDAAGRPMKREWEKGWFKNAVGSAATGGLLAGGALVTTKTHVGRTKIQPALRKAMKWTEDRGYRIFSRRLGRMIYLDEWANEKGWDVRDPRGRSARVYAPGSKRRVRREAEWHETKDAQKRILAGLSIVGTAAGIGGGVLIGRRMPAKAVVAKTTNIIDSGIKKRA